MRIGQLHICLDTPLTGADWKHGDKADPNKWPWWKRFYVDGPMKLDLVAKPSVGYRIWLYMRTKAWNLDLYLDRRPNK